MSGIGTAAFEQGGFILDGGHWFGTPGAKHDFRTLVASHSRSTARSRLPEDQHILLVTPDIGTGAHEGGEVDIFRKHCPVSLHEVRAPCNEVLMRMVPALVELDIDLLSSAINRIQTLTFKKDDVAMQHPACSILTG